MASSAVNEFQLRSLPFLDAKWLRADLQSALRSSEDISILWNNLVRDNELVCSNTTTTTVAINVAGNVAYMQNSGKFYCGMEKLTCNCCTGYCRPTADCNCMSCRQLDTDETTTAASATKRLPNGNAQTLNSNVSHEVQFENFPASDAILDSWLWNQTPSDDEKELCIKSMLTEQRLLSLQVAGHSLTATHLKYRLFIYHRYFTALVRHSKSKPVKNTAAPKIQRNESAVKKLDREKSNKRELNTSAAVEKATFGLALVGTRAALNFSFAFLRRAWRSGEDIELCSELLMEALDAMQDLPEASLFDTAQVSALWLEVLERSLKFLRQVVVGDVITGARGAVPKSDRDIALSLLMELESQKGTLSASLEAILLLLTLWEKEKDTNDNRTQQLPQNSGAPLKAILKRYESINQHTNATTPTVANLIGSSLAPTESFLRFLTLPEHGTANIDLRQAAVVIISHLDRLAKLHLPATIRPLMSNSQQCPAPQILSMGSIFVTNDNYGFTVDSTNELPVFGQSAAGFQYHLNALLKSTNKSITIKSIACAERQIILLTTAGEVYSIDTSGTNAMNNNIEQKTTLNTLVNDAQSMKQIDGFGNVPVLSVVAHCEGRHFLALNAEHHVYAWGANGNGQLGLNDMQSREAPTKITSFADKYITKVFCGAEYSAAITISGELYTWGRGSYGCLGHGSFDDKLEPAMVQALHGHSIVDVALGCGNAHSLCVTDDGHLFAFGDGDFGKLGNGSCNGSQLPIQIDGIPLVSRVYSGDQYSIFVTPTGHVYTFGKRQGGRLGHSTTDYGQNSRIVAAMKLVEGPVEYCHIPKKICALDNKHIVDIAVGSAHCLAITDTGELYGWGRNDFQQICHSSVSRDPIIATPILTAPASFRIEGMVCGSAYSVLFCNSSVMGIETRIPYVVDLTESTFKSLEQLLSIVSASGPTDNARAHPPSQEFECISVACLHLLRLQFYALISNNVAPKSVGLGDSSRLLTNLKVHVLHLAGGSNILKTIQEAAQKALQIGWSILLPSASERAQTLTALLPPEAGVSPTSGHRFMTDLLVGSLMAEEGLRTALKQAINADVHERANSQNNLPLLHLIKQLLRNNAALTQARLAQLLITGSTYFKSSADILTKVNEPLSPSLDLLHRFQRLLLAHIHQSTADDLSNAETLLGKYIQTVVQLSITTLSKAYEVATHGKEVFVGDILSADLSDTLLYELMIGLVLLHRDRKSIILQSFDWNNTFIPLLNVLDDLNRLICESDAQDIDSMGWPGIVCRGTSKVSQPTEELLLIRLADFENHVLDNSKWIIVNGFVCDLQNYQSESPATNELLINGIGKDLSTELNNPIHRSAMEHITTHLKVGKFASSDSDEKHVSHETSLLTHLESERTLSFLLGLRATLLQKATPLQPAEIQCHNLLKSPVFSGGLQVLQPTNPFDEEKGEARSSTSTAGSTPIDSGHVNLAEITQTIHWPHTLITHRVDSLLNGLGEGRLTDPLVATWITIAERFCKENHLIWHQDFPPEHPISELERSLTAIFIRHQSLGPLVLAVVDRELSSGSSVEKLPQPVADIIKLVHQTKWTLIKTRQQLNRSYKEVCAPMLDKCRFLLYEVRPAISVEQCALHRLKILHRTPRFKGFVRRIISDMRAAKKSLECAKPEDILNVTIQSQCSSFTTKNQSNENMTDTNEELNVSPLPPRSPPPPPPLSTHVDTTVDDLLKQTDDHDDTDNRIDDDCTKTPAQMKQIHTKNQFINDEHFIDDVIAKLSEKCIINKMNGDTRVLDAPKIVSMIVDFVLQDPCDVETLRRAMYCQAQRYKIRKQGIDTFAQLLQVGDLLETVQYNLLSGYLGLFVDQTKQHYYMETVLNDLNMVTSFQKVELIHAQAKIIEWAIAELQTFINQEQRIEKRKHYAIFPGKDTSNLGRYSIAKSMPRARFLLSVFGILAKNFGAHETSLIINAGALGSVLCLLRQTGTADTTPAKSITEMSFVYEDTIAKKCPKLITGPELAKLMKADVRVVRGNDWKWGDQDGPSGEGRIINEVGDDGWVRVEWDNGTTNSYRMGKEGQYDLRLADNTSPMITPDTETDDDTSLIDIQLTGNSHPTKLLKNASMKMLKLISVNVGLHGDKIERCAIANIASMFRSLLVSKSGVVTLGLEQWMTLGFLRAISQSRQLADHLTSTIWLQLHIDMINSPIINEQDVYKKIHSIRLLHATSVHWDEANADRVEQFVEKLFECLGRIVLYCPNDLSVLHSSADVKSRVLMSASHSGTVAEELIVLLRKLHALPLWNNAISSYISQKLCIAAELFSMSTETDNDHEAMAQAVNEEIEKSLVIGALNAIGGCDPRPRVGSHIQSDTFSDGTITTFTVKGKALISYGIAANPINFPEKKKISLNTASACAATTTFNMNRLPLNEMLLNALTVLIYGPDELRTKTTVDIGLLRMQQIHLATLNATSVLFKHQSSLRKILRQRCPGISRYSSDESISENERISQTEAASAKVKTENLADEKKSTPEVQRKIEPNTSNENVEVQKDIEEHHKVRADNELLIQNVLARATQSNPIKSMYSYTELSLAALNLSQQLAAHLHTEHNNTYLASIAGNSSSLCSHTTANRPPIVHPTLIHGIPIYNEMFIDELQTPSSEGSAAPGISGGVNPRRTSNTATRKPTTIEEMHVNSVMKMGFHRKIVELAVRTLRQQEIPPVIGRIVEWIIEHPDECATVNTTDVLDVDSDTDSMSTNDNSLSMNDSSHTKYALREDFKSADQYAMYVRGLVHPGMAVRCCQDFEEIRKGDVGIVQKVDTEGLHDLNVQVDWRQHEANYWMCFVHIEILEPKDEAKTMAATATMSSEANSQQRIMIGSHVRIRSNVATPRYKWGSVPRGSIGVVTAVHDNGTLSVDFPQQFNWTGQMNEMELVCQGNPAAAGQLNGTDETEPIAHGELIEDWSRCIRSLSVSSNESAAKYLLDRSPNYWQSSSTQNIGAGKHWIRLEMHENVLVYLLSVVVNGSDCSHMPSLIVVRVGDTIENLKDFSWVSIKNSDTNVPLLSDLRQYYKWIEIVIKQCRNNGIQCKVHGANITGRRKQTDMDLMLMNASFLATDNGSICEPTASTSCTSGTGEKSDSSINSQCKVWCWGLNDKEQLAGLKGSKVKCPTLSTTVSQLRPVHIAGGSKSLFIVSQDGKVYACGEGTNGRLGLGHNYNVSTPRKLPVLSQYVVKKVAVHSGGKHAMALTVDGKVFSWGEGEDGKLGHNNRITLDKPKLIDALKSKRIRDIACGSSHSAAITSSGELYLWGLGEYGRLGHGDNFTQLKPKLVEALLGHRVVQVACGSRDAQTLALTEDGIVFSWGDGDFGKLGRGGSEGCSIPHQVERLNDAGVIQIECGAQFSLALTINGEVWTWGKGDYFRLGHGSDQHVRKPTPVQGLRGKKVVHVAVGALHCLAVTDIGQVFSWGDNDHGQQGTGTTVVNKKPCSVIGLDNVFVNRVACGSSHSIAWSLPQCAAEEDKKEPLPFGTMKDPLGGSSLGIYDSEPISYSSTKTYYRPSLSEVLLSLDTYGARQTALNYVLKAMSILQARQCVIASLTSHTQMNKSSEKLNANNEEYLKELDLIQTGGPVERVVETQIVETGGGEALADITSVNDEPESPDLSTNDLPHVIPAMAGPLSAFQSLNGSMSASISSNKHSKMSVSAMSVMAATITQPDEVINDDTVSSLDDFTTLLDEPEAKNLIELLKLAVDGRCGPTSSAQTISNTLVALGTHSPSITIMILETCITELEDLCTSRHFLGKSPRPIAQETTHPYIDDITLVGHVRIPNAEALRLEFDQQCSTEKRNDPLVIMDGTGRVIATRSGREYAQWAPEIRVPGDEVQWKFTSDSSVNGWGWRFFVHGIMPASFEYDTGSDRTILSQPSMEFVMALLDSSLEPPNQNVLLRLAAALAACGQLSNLTTAQRIWALKRLHRILMTKVAPKPLDPLLLPILEPLITCLLKQYEYEESHVRTGIHLMHSEYLKTLAALACDAQLDALLLSADMQRWAWFRRFCSAARVAQSLINRTPLPLTFCTEVRKQLSEMCPSMKSTNVHVPSGSAMNSSMISNSSNNSSINNQYSTNSAPGLLTAGQFFESVHSTSSLDNYNELSTSTNGLPETTQTYLHEDHSLFKRQHDRQLLQWLNRRPEDWAMSWGGASTIYGWGHNHRGQLGGLDGGRIKTPTPCESLSLLRPIHIAGGEQTVYAVTPDGKCYATGLGAGGRLGIGGTESIGTPILIEALQHVFIKKVAVNSGGKHCLALTADGEVYSWGEGDDGKLGHNNRLNYERPKLIEALTGIGVVDIACGSAHSACITSSGHVLTWGKGRYGRLGHGDSEDQLRPKLVEALLGYRAIDIACGSGDAQTLCITDDDNVFSWGDGDYGKLGRGGSEGCKYPIKIESLAGLAVMKVECGSQFSVALTRSGAVYTWGKGDYHRLGHGSVDHVRRPKKVASLQGKKIVSIATGSLHCVACTDTGEVYTWGDNDEGQLGDGTVSAIQRPRLVAALQGKHIIKVTCGSAHTLALSISMMRDGSHLPPTPPLEYDFVRDLPPDALHARLVLLHHFSEMICPCLAMLPVTGELSLAALKDLLVYSIKEAAFRKVIQTTMVRDKQHGPVFELNRIQVKRSRTKSSGGLAGIDGLKSVFGQMVQKLPLLNQESLYLPHRVWKVKFVGESVDDCGGGFSESIAEMCDELQNGSVPLLIQTPNGRGEAGANRDCFLLDPTLESVLQENMFRFLGVLMGIAVRTGSPLSLNLAEPVWRQLTGEELRPSDLTEVDRDYVTSLICIRDMEDDAKVFQALDLPFSTPSAKGHDVQLSTRYNRITAANKYEYVRLALNHRLHEFDEQVKAVRDGMSKVIPAPLLSLFSASQLQAMVCGSPEIPLGLLKSVATYKGVEATSSLVQWFWEVMEEFSNQERSLFLRFVWGRTRLPRTIADFRGRDFVLQVLDKYHPADHFLPESYTCFFLLKMPRYSCKAVLLEKLKYAIYFCKSIDTDEYARVAMVEPTEPTASENNSDIDSEVSEEL